VPGDRAASDLLDRLKRSYTNGDLRGVTGLFTANAVVNRGAGLAFIRRHYATLFKRDRQRQISIFGMHWREGSDERLVGTGQIRLSGRESRSSEWRRRQGRIELELVPWRGQYRINKMIHHLSER
jgi:hypothetical protein